MSRYHQCMLATVATCMLGFVATCQAAGIDACKLISADQASKILGSKVGAHSMNKYDTGPNSSSMCNFGDKTPSGGFMLIAGHVDYTDAAKEVARREKEMLSDTPPGLPVPSFAPIKGLGDAAYLAKATGYFQLHVLAHGSVIVINRNVAASPKAVEQVKQIARVVLGRLK